MGYDKIVHILKLVGIVATVTFTVCSFISSTITLSPRVTDLEKRVANNEARLSGIETKLNMLMDISERTHEDVKDIYKILIK